MSLAGKVFLLNRFIITSTKDDIGFRDPNLGTHKNARQILQDPVQLILLTVDVKQRPMPISYCY